MTYDIEGRNVVVYPDVADPDEESTWVDDLVGQFGLILLIAGVSIAGLVVYGGLPVSLYCLALAAVAWLLDRAHRKLTAEGWSEGIWMPLLTGVVGDGRLAAIWLTGGLVAVWLLQLLLNLGDPGRADGIGALELRVYDWSERLSTASSPGYLLAALLVALACSAMVSSPRPLIALGFTRRTLSAAIAFLTAASSFSFVAPATLASHNSAAVDAVRTATAAQLETAARARRERAAFQWLAAEFTREAKRNPDSPSRWRGYFARAQAVCGSRSECNTEDLLIQLARERTSPVAAYDPFFSPTVGPASDWLPEYRSAIVEPPTAGDSTGFAPEGEVQLDQRLRHSGDLIRMRHDAGQAAVRASRARDAIRGVVVDAVGEMLGPNFGRLADQVVDIWRNSILEVLATEARARIAGRLRALDIDVTRLFAAPPELARLPSKGFPLESPHSALGRGASIETLVQADWETMHARETSLAARRLAEIGRRSFDTLEAGRLRGARAPYRPPPRPPARAPRVPFR